MATWKITDPSTGKAFNVDGDQPPSEAELDQIFASLKEPSVAPAEGAPPADDSAPENPIVTRKRELQKQQQAIAAEGPAPVAFGTATGNAADIGTGFGRLVSGVTKGVGDATSGLLKSLGSVFEPQSEESDQLPENIEHNPVETREAFKQNPIRQLGEQNEEYYKELYEKYVPERERETVLHQAGQAGVGLLPAATGPFAPYLFALSAAGEHFDSDYDRAISEGKSPEDAARIAQDSALLSGTKEAALWEFGPKAFHSFIGDKVKEKIGSLTIDKGARRLANIATSGAEMGTLSGASKAGENLIEGDPITQDVGTAAVSGALLGAGMGAATMGSKGFPSRGDMPPMPEPGQIPPEPVTPPNANPGRLQRESAVSTPAEVPPSSGAEQAADKAPLSREAAGRLKVTAARMLIRRGVDPDTANRFAAMFVDKFGHRQIGEEFRSDLNQAFDDSGFLDAGHNTYSDEDRLRAAAEANGFTEDDIQAGIAKRKDRAAEIEAHNKALIDQIQGVENNPDPNPTEAQKEAGVFKMGHDSIQGLDISVENRKGGTREKKDENGNVLWSVQMPADYGYIKGTEGNDGDHVDAYVGPNKESQKVWVVDQKNADTGEFDEHKTLLGFDSLEQALDTYHAGFSDGRGGERVQGITEMSMPEFKEWLKSGDTTKPLVEGKESNATENGTQSENDQQKHSGTASGENVPENVGEVRQENGGSPSSSDSAESGAPVPAQGEPQKEAAVAPQVVAKRYFYQSPLRPVMSISQALPKGWQLEEDGSGDRRMSRRFSVDKPLSFAQENSLELEPEDPRHPKNVKKAYDKYHQEVTDILGESGGSGEVIRKDGRRKIISEAINPKDGEWRVTWLDKDGTPTGHQFYSNWDDMVREALWGDKDDISEIIPARTSKPDVEVEPVKAAPKQEVAREAKKSRSSGINEEDGLLFTIVGEIGKVPAFLPGYQWKKRYEAIRRKQETGDLLSREDKEFLANKVPKDYRDTWWGGSFERAYEAAKKAGIANELFAPTDNPRVDVGRDVLKGLGDRGKEMNANELWDEIYKLSTAKAEQKNQQAAKDIQDKLDAAWLNDTRRGGPGNKKIITPGKLAKWDVVTVNRKKLVVQRVTPEEVTLNGGEAYGTRVLRPDEKFYAQKYEPGAARPEEDLFNRAPAADQQPVTPETKFEQSEELPPGATERKPSGELVYGVPREQWDEMAKLNEQQQLDKFGTSRSRLMQEAILPKYAKPEPETKLPKGSDRLTEDERKELGKLVKKEIAARKGGEPWSDDEGLRYAQLMKKAGQKELPIEAPAVVEKAQTVTEPEKPTKYRLGNSPQTFTLVEKLEQSEVEKENGEQPVRVRNDKTGKEEVVLEQDLTPVRERTAEEKAKTNRVTRKELDEQLLKAGMAPEGFPDMESKRAALKRWKATRDSSLGDGSSAAADNNESIKLDTIDDIRKAVDDREIPLEDGHRKVLQWLLKTGLLEKMPGLRFEAVSSIEGGFHGEYTWSDRLARFAHFSESETPIHEFFHHVWRFLSPEDRAFVRSLRISTMEHEAPQMGDTFKEGMSSQDFADKGFDRGLYKYANDSEFFTWLFTERAKQEMSQPESRGFIQRVSGYLRDLYHSLKSALGFSPYQNVLWRDIITGKYDFEKEPISTPDDRELSLGSDTDFVPPGEEDGGAAEDTEVPKRHQVAGVKELGEEYEPENIERIQNTLRENLFDGRQPFTPEGVAAAFDTAERMLDRNNANWVREQAGGAEMAPGLLVGELWKYAVRMTANQDSSLLQYMIQNYHNFQTIAEGGGGFGQAGRVLRAAGELAKDPLWNAMRELTTNRMQAIRRRLGVGEEAFENLIDSINNLQLPPEQIEQALLSGELPGGQTVRQVIEEQRPARRALSELESILDRYERSQTEWLKPEKSLSGAREIIKTAIENGPLARYQDRAEFIRRVADRFINELNAPRDLAERLADEVWKDKTDRETSATAKAQRAEERREQRNAESMLDRWAREQTEWVNPKRRSEVRDLLKTFFDGEWRPADAEEMQRRFAWAGVAESTARELADQAMRRRAAMEASARARAMEKEIEAAGKSANREAKSILDKLEARNTEWVKPEAKDSVAKAVREALRPLNKAERDELAQLNGKRRTAEEQSRYESLKLRDFIPQSDPSAFRNPLRDKLVSLGVEPGVAYNLADEVARKRIDDWSAMRTRAMERAKTSNSLGALIEQLRQTPYRLQKDPAWRKKVAADWLMSNGLSREQAEAVSDQVSGRIEELLQRAAEKVARKLLDKEKARTVDDIIMAIRAGLTDPSKSWSDAFADRAGFKPLTPDQQTKIAELDEKLANQDLSMPERSELTDQLNSIFQRAGDGSSHFKRAIGEMFAANKLSGVPTATLHFFQPLITTMVRDFPIEALISARDAASELMSGNVKEAASAAALFPKKLLAYVDSLKQFPAEFLHAAKTDTYYLSRSKMVSYHNELRHQFEDGLKSAQSGDVRGALKLLHSWVHFFVRGLQSANQANQAVAREWKLATYGSQTMRDAGMTTGEISRAIDKISELKQSFVQDGLDKGMSWEKAHVRANDLAFQAMGKYFSDVMPASSLTGADSILRSAENEHNSLVGRLSAEHAGDEEGWLSSWFNKLILRPASEMRKDGGFRSALGATLFGFVNVPWRSSKYLSNFSPYGFLRYGRYKLGQARGWENPWKQSLETEIQARQRLMEASIGTAFGAMALALFHSSTDPDREKRKFGIYVTGNWKGITNRVVRQSLDRIGMKPMSINVVVNGQVRSSMPLTRTGHALGYMLAMSAIADDIAWKHKEAEASGKPVKDGAIADVMTAIGTLYQIIGPQGILNTIAHAQEVAQGSVGTSAVAKTLTDLLSNFVGGFLPAQVFQNQMMEAAKGAPDRSSLTSMIAANMGVLGAKWRQSALNRFGDSLYDTSWYSKALRLGIPASFRVEQTPENERIYSTIVQKGVAPPEIRRYLLEEKYGPLTDDQWSKFVKTSGENLKEMVTSSLSAVADMDPPDLKKFFSKTARTANAIAVSELQLEEANPKPKNSIGGGRIPADETSKPLGSASTKVNLGSGEPSSGSGDSLSLPKTGRTGSGSGSGGGGLAPGLGSGGRLRSGAGVGGRSGLSRPRGVVSGRLRTSSGSLRTPSGLRPRRLRSR